MSDWFGLASEIQREILRAQRAQIDAAQKMLDAGKDVTQLHEAGQKVAEANLSYWKQWAKLWGIK
jgi:FAD/FMN-containing dehydrogenase